MPAWDNISLAPPPQPPSYNSGFQNFLQLGDRLAQLPQSYWAGQNQAYTQRMRNLFQNGVPADPSQMAAQTIQAGGGDYAAKLAPFMMQNQLLSSLVNGGSQPPTGGQSGPGQTGTGSDHLGGGTYTGGAIDQSTVPPGASAGDVSYGEGNNTSGSPAPSGGEGGGATTVASMAAPYRLPPMEVAKISRTLGIPKDQPIGDPTMRDKVEQALIDANQPRLAQGQFRGGEPGMPGGSPSEGGSSIPQTASGSISRAVNGLVPQGYDPVSYANALIRRGTGLNLVNRGSGNGLIQQGNNILQAIAKSNELTPEEKKARASGVASPLDYERRTKAQETDITAGEKKYEGLQAQADQAHQLVQTLNLNKSLMDDPNFYSGVGEEYNLLWKRLKVGMGLDPNAALPQEAFRKTVSSAIMDQIRSIGGQGLGQVRVAEINVMKQAAQNEDNSPAANRLLSEMQMRMATKWTIPLAEMAQAYKAGGTVTENGQKMTFQPHLYLDAGWDKVKSQYINSTQLYAKDELEDPRRIAPPLARTPADLKRIGWKDGTPFRTPDGRILTHLAPQGQ